MELRGVITYDRVLDALTMPEREVGTRSLQREVISKGANTKLLQRATAAKRKREKSRARQREKLKQRRSMRRGPEGFSARPSTKTLDTGNVTGAYTVTLPLGTSTEIVPLDYHEICTPLEQPRCSSCDDVGSDVSRNGYTALMFAARNGHRECLRWLLAAHADKIDQQDGDGYSALVWAAQGGQEECIRLLLVAGAMKGNRADSNGDIVLTTKSGVIYRYSIRTAEEDGYTRKLLAAGAGAHFERCPSSSSTNALIQAASNGHEACVQTLVDAGSQLDEQDCHGHTALNQAPRNGHGGCRRILLCIEAGAHTDKDTLSVIMYHGTSATAARAIGSSGFCRSINGVLVGPGVYLSPDITKARCCVKGGNGVVLRCRVQPGRSTRIDRKDEPHRRAWGTCGYDPACIARGYGVVKMRSGGGRAETCVKNPDRIQVFGRVE
jgi:hypothetical protein